MKLSRNITIIVLISLFCPSLIFSSYLIYPKLNSGNNLPQLYDSFLTRSLERRFYFSSFVLSDFKQGLDYGYLFGVDMEKYGELSFAYVERDLGIRQYGISYKESSYNLSYQYDINIVGLLFGVNLADPLHSEYFKFTQGFLYSFNLGLKLKPVDFLLLELGVFNIGKDLSYDELDFREYFYSSVYIFILDDLSLKFSFHLFREYRIMSNVFLSYSINNNIALDFSFSSEPLSFGLATRFNFYLFSLKLSGLFRDDDLYAFISLGFVWGASGSSFKGIVDVDDIKGVSEVSRYLININTADREELSSLPGIGNTLSSRIVEYRELYGLFYSKREIIEVQGIGTKAFNRFKDLITIGNVDFASRLAKLIRWTMKDFIEIGFPPSLSLNLVIYIRNNHPIGDLDSLFAVDGFSKGHLDNLRAKLEEYTVNKPLKEKDN